MKTFFSPLFQLSLLSSVLVIAPGCSTLDWIQEKLGSTSTGQISSSTQEQPSASARTQTSAVTAPTGDVLVSIEGTPAITVQSFEKDFNTLLESNPQVAQVMQLYPDLKEKVFEGLVNQKIENYYIEKNKIDETPEYKEQLHNLIESSKQLLNDAFFTKKFPATVSDSDAKKFYEENKAQIPDFIVSWGGVNTQGVSFDSEADAKSFLDKVKGKSKDFEKLAKDAGFGSKFKDFRLINPQSAAVDKEIRSKVAVFSSFPTIEVVKGADNKFWVINASSKEEAKYQPFEQVKQVLKDHLQKEKQDIKKQEEINKLKTAYNVQINTDYFQKEKEKNKSDRAEKMQEILKQQQLDKEASAAPASAAKSKSA